MFKIGHKYLIILFFAFTPLFVDAQNDVDEQLAMQYFRQGEFDKAAGLFKDIYAKKPNTYYYNYYLNSLFGLQDYAAAENFVKKVQKSRPGELRYLVDLGYVYELSGNKKKADKIFKKAIKKMPSTRQAYVSLSGAFQNRGHYDYALKILEKGKNKFTPPLNIEIADLYFSKGEYNRMIDSYLDMIEKNDDYLEAVKGKLQLIIASPGNNKVSQALREELLKRTEKYPNKTIYAELLYWYSVQKREWDIALFQAKSLDKRFDEGGERVFQLSNILLSNHRYAEAAEGFKYIMSLGPDNRFYRASEISLLHAEFKNLVKNGTFRRQDLQTLVGQYNKVLKKYGENRSTVELMRNLAHIDAFYLHDIPAAEELLEKVTKMPGLNKKIRAEAKLELGDVLLFEGKKWTASLLYKQVEKEFKNDPVGFEAKFKAAQFYYYVGEMEWAKVQLDVLKGATSKLIANDAMDLSLLISGNIDPDSTYTSLSYFARAQLLVYQKRYDEAFKTLDTIENAFPGFPVLSNVEYERARIYMQMKNYAKAVEHFKATAEKYPGASITDNALIELARLYDNILNDSKKARDVYEKILLDYPGSIFTVEARKRFNELKEDE